MSLPMSLYGVYSVLHFLGEYGILVLVHIPTYVLDFLWRPEIRYSF